MLRIQLKEKTGYLNLALKFNEKFKDNKLKKNIKIVLTKLKDNSDNCCLTQRPIQTIILMYLIGRKKIKFRSVFFTKLKHKDKSKNSEERRLFNSLKFQCDLSKIPLHILESPNDMNISKYVKI